MYNARKRGEDRASDYFKRTENVAGVKDMRFQALMPDILHWLGITKIDRMLSMSKYVLSSSTYTHPIPLPASPLVRGCQDRTASPLSLSPAPSLSQIDRLPPGEGRGSEARFGYRRLWLSKAHGTHD